MDEQWAREHIGTTPAVEVAEDVKIIPHDGLMLIGSDKARQERHNVVGAYFDRLGNLQEIRQGSLYDIHLQRIPASKVLQPGMVQVDRGVIELAIQWYHAVQDLNPAFLDPEDVAAYERIKILRSQAGEVKP